MKRRREYLQLLDKAIHASEAAIDSFNRVHNPYRDEGTLILATNGWELLAKAILKKRKQSIAKGRQGNTISAQDAVSKLNRLALLDDTQEDCIQQIISLRHAAAHHILPPVPAEVMQHLLFFVSKFFRETVASEFPAHGRKLHKNYLSLSFSDLTTYADKVQKLVSRVKRSEQDKRLVWLLDRGIRFDGNSYITESQFTAQYRHKKKIMPHLGINGFLKRSEMVRLVPVQAPKNYTADITLRKGKANDPSLPIIVKKTDVEKDYPYLTKELGEKLGKTQNYAAALIACVGLKGDSRYHQRVRASTKSYVERYSDTALHRLREFLNSHQNYNPYANRPKKP
jgi:hypothetical protein